MDGTWEYYIKWSKSQKDKYDITYMWNLKNNKNYWIQTRESQQKNLRLP